MLSDDDFDHHYESDVLTIIRCKVCTGWTPVELLNDDDVCDDCCSCAEDVFEAYDTDQFF